MQGGNGMKKISRWVAMIMVCLLTLTGAEAAGLDVGFAPAEIMAYSAHTQSEAVAWAQSQLGKALDYDGQYGAQCVDLICYYYQYLGTTSPGGNAEAYRRNNLPSGWIRVYGNYQPGDIAVWKPSYSHGSYSTSAYGHVGIVTSADSVGFNAVGQNVGNNKYCTQNWFPLQVVECAIRPDFGSTSSATISYSNIRTNWTDTWNAEIAGDIQNPGRATVAQVGAYVWDSTGTCVVDHRENCGLNYSTINQTLNIVSEARPSGLQSGETYTYQIWANANNQYYFSGKASFTIQDNTKPVISNVKISNLTSEGYTVTCTATDNYKIDRVQFPTWTAVNEQDDIVKDWWSNAKCRGIQTGNTFSFTVRRSDHNGEYGVYRTHIYAYDKAGNYSYAPLNVINVEEKKVSDSVKPGNTGKVSSSTVQKKQPTTSQNNKTLAVKVKRRTRNSVTLQWKKMKNVTGYRVYRSTKKNSGYKLIKKLNKNTVKYTNKKLKRKKTYYYKIVPMIKSGRKVYKGKAAIIRVKTLK